jgi:hypothetical protein
VVIFDRQGTYIGPIIEVSGFLADPKYAVNLDLDSIMRVKRSNLKVGDLVYYYNRDRLCIEVDTIQDELSLIEKKWNQKTETFNRVAKTSKHTKYEMAKNKRDLTLGYNPEASQDCMEDELNSTSKNTRSIASVALNSCYNRNLIVNHLEKQKSKRYRRIKASMLGNLGNPPEEKTIIEEALDDQIEDELELGKRKNCSTLHKFDTSINHSAYYSKLSYDIDRNSN